MKTILFLLLCVCASTSDLFAQCPPPGSVTDYPCGSGTPLINNANVNTGQVHYTAGAGPYNVNINGGTLVICGTVTFNSVNFSGGTILVKSGASVTFNNSYNAGSTHWFYNYGSVVFNLPVFLSGSNTFVYNAANSSIIVNEQMVILNDGLFVNNGTALVQDLILNSNSNVCLGNESVVNLRSLTNNHTNAVEVGSGTACVSYSASFTGNNPITNSAGLRICQLEGASAPDPVVIGTAEITQDCESCSILLPVTLDYFKGTTAGRQAMLEWKTSMEENVLSYQIEQSVDQVNFSVIGEVAARNVPGTYHYPLTITGTAFFRLKIVDIDGKVSYSAIITLRQNVAEISLQLKTNPVIGATAQLHILSGKREQGTLQIIDQSGVLRRTQAVQLNEGENIIRVNVQQLSRGMYYMIYVNANGKSKPLTMVLQ